MLGLVLPVSALAETFVVNSTADPDTGNPANCAGPASDCSFRDAIAAADVAADLDEIAFDVKDTIYLRKQLIAQQPVLINGLTANGKKTAVRVHQGYTVAMLPDPNENYDLVATLQPTYYRAPVSLPQLLVVHGDGSSVNNLEIDGSITPAKEDVGLYRLDRDSDGVIDFYVVTLEPKNGQFRWPIADGIYADFREAPYHAVVDLSDNEIRYVNGDALKIERFRSAMVSNNVISGGRAHTFLASGAGLFAYDGANLTISNNSVTGYREGLALLVSATVSVINNDLVGNTNAMTFDYVSEYVGQNYNGPNVVADNLVSENTGSGIAVRSVVGMSIENNRIKLNGTDNYGPGEVYGIDVRGSVGITIASNEIKENGTDARDDGGIRIVELPAFEEAPWLTENHNSVVDNSIKYNSGVGVVIETATHNTVGENDIKYNGGVGIVLLGGATNNTVQLNDSSFNDGGIVALPTGPQAAPVSNFINENIFLKNTEFDVADFEPVCFFNTWLNNTYDTVHSDPAVGSCFP